MQCQAEQARETVTFVWYVPTSSGSAPGKHIQGSPPVTFLSYPHPKSQHPWSLIPVPVRALVSTSIDCGHVVPKYLSASPLALPHYPDSIWVSSTQAFRARHVKHHARLYLSKGPQRPSASDAFSCPHIILKIFLSFCVRHDLVPFTATHPFFQYIFHPITHLASVATASASRRRQKLLHLLFSGI